MKIPTKDEFVDLRRQLTQARYLIEGAYEWAYVVKSHDKEKARERIHEARALLRNVIHNLDGGS